MPGHEGGKPGPRRNNVSLGWPESQFNAAVGYSARASRDNAGHVTQICISPDYRGRDLGRLLMVECARSLARRRFTLLTRGTAQVRRGP